MHNFSPNAICLINELSQNEAKENNSVFVEPEHILLAMIKNHEGLGFEVLKILSKNILSLQIMLEKSVLEVKNKSTLPLNRIPRSNRFETVINQASKASGEFKNDYIGTEHIAYACLTEKDSATENFFKAVGIFQNDVKSVVLQVQHDFISSYSVERKKYFENNSEVNGMGIFDDLFESMNFNNESDYENSADREKDEKKKKNYLDKFTTDLTKQYQDGKKEAVIGREKEITRIIQVLSRKTKNNPMIIGEPGIGKTAIVDGLAEAIVEGRCPVGLMNKRVLLLDVASIVSGTRLRGEFEERMKKIIRDVKAAKDIILFIDEFHTVVGAGSPDGQLDAAQMLKTALTDGDFQVIGATTTKEWTKYIEKDAALVRRFQKILIEEPTDDEAIKILEGVKPNYEKFHGVVYEDGVLESIVKMTRRYMPDRLLPDKALDVLDEAGARKKISEANRPPELLELENQVKLLTREKEHFVQAQDFENAAFIRDKVGDVKQQIDVFNEKWRKANNVQNGSVSKMDVATIVGEITGIPKEHIASTQTQKLITMEADLHKSVIGQEEAVKTISSAIRRSRAGISSPKRPIGSFVFLGPTGVGKTQLAKALAKFIFGDEKQIIRVDMSDFMEKHNTSRLVGAPPGYVGYGEGGTLTDKVRQHPYSVVLFDEIEKAHADVFNLLLQILEEGELQDSMGHTVNFRNTIIIMTSNAGARKITAEGKVGFGFQESGVLPYDEIKSNATAELKKVMLPELLNRIDDVIVFNALTKDEISKILDKQLDELKERLKDKNLSIIVKKSAREYLIEKGYEPAMGARPMRRVIQREIEDPLSFEILDEKNAGLTNIVVNYIDEKLSVKFSPSEVAEDAETKTTIKCVSTSGDEKVVISTVNG